MILNGFYRTGCCIKFYAVWLPKFFFKFLTWQSMVSLYADLPGMWVSDSPRQQSLLFTSLIHIILTLLFTMIEPIRWPYWSLHAPMIQWTTLNLSEIIAGKAGISVDFVRIWSTGGSLLLWYHWNECFRPLSTIIFVISPELCQPYSKGSCYDEITL